MPIYEYNGERYNLPDDVVSEFVKDFPAARLVEQPQVEEPYVSIGAYRPSFTPKVEDTPVPLRPEGRADRIQREEEERDAFSRAGANISLELGRVPFHTVDADAVAERLKQSREVADEVAFGFREQPFSDKSRAERAAKQRMQNVKAQDDARDYIAETMGIKKDDITDIGEYTQEGGEYYVDFLRAEEKRMNKELDDALTKQRDSLYQQVSASLQEKMNKINPYTDITKNFLRGIGTTQWGAPQNRSSYMPGIDDEQTAVAYAAARALSLAKGMQEAAHDDGMWGNFWEGVLSGLTEAGENMTDAKKMNDAIATVVKKWEEGGETTKLLNDDEKMLLDALAYQTAVASMYQDEISSSYNVGNIVGAMGPWMVEFVVNPASGLGRKAASRFGKYALKRFAKNTANKYARSAIYNTGRGLGRIGGSLAGGAVMTATTGAPKTVVGVQERMLGRPDVNYADGKPVYAGQIDREAFLPAVRKEVTKQILEYGTEMLGAGYFDDMLTGVNKLFKGTKWQNWIGRITSGHRAQSVKKFMGRAGWNGPVEEFLEEVHVGLLEPYLVGDNTHENFFNKNNLIEVALGVAIPGVVVSTAKTVAGAADGSFRAGAQERWKMEHADRRATELWGNWAEWKDLRNSLMVSQPEEIEAKLKEIANSTKLTDKQKMAAIDFGIYSLQYRTARGVADAMTDGRRKEINSMLHELYYSRETERESGYNAQPDEMSSVQDVYEDERARVLETLGEDVVARLDEDPIGALADMNEYDVVEASAYVNAKARRDGMLDRISDDIDERIKASDKEIDQHANKGDGMIHPAMMRGVNGATPKRVYIVNGNVATFEDGTIDKANSSSMIIVRDAETGEVSAASADDLESLDAVIDTEAEKRTVAEQIANEYAQQQAAIIEGKSRKLTYNSNDGVHTVEILGENGDVFTILDNGVERIATREWVDELKAQNGVVSPVEAAQPVERPELSNAEQLSKEKQAPTPIPVEKRGKEERAAYHLVPIERTMEDLDANELTQEEKELFTQANIDEITKDIEALDKKEPKMGANIQAYKTAKQQWQSTRDDLQARLDYYNALMDRLKQPVVEVAAVEQTSEQPAVESVSVAEQAAEVAPTQVESTPVAEQTAVEETPATNEMQSVQEVVEPTAEEVSPAVESAPIAETPQATNEMQEAELAPAEPVTEETRQKRVEEYLDKDLMDVSQRVYGVEYTMYDVLPDDVVIYRSNNQYDDRYLYIIAARSEDKAASVVAIQTENGDWTLKLGSKNKEMFKELMSKVLSKLPRGARIFEEMDVTPDGLRVFAQQLKHGFTTSVDTYETYLGKAKYSEAKDDYTFSKRKIKVNEGLSKLDEVRSEIAQQLDALGVPETAVTIGQSDIRGFAPVKLTLPYLVKQTPSSVSSLEFANSSTSEVVSPVAESTPVAEVEAPQATNEMQTDLENAEKGEKGQKAVEPVEENKPKVRGRKQVNVESLMGALKQNGEAKLSDHVEQTTNPSGNKLVTDERYNELKERMKKKLKGQMNIGVDPEILAIGTEMAVYHIEKGARKFADFAKGMIADLGDAIRPYLKAFYNGARELPEIEEAGFTKDMTPYEEVKTFDVANFDKQAQNAIAAIDAKIENLKEFQEELTQKFREESEAKAKEQGDLVSTYIKERKAENKGGFYKIRPVETETKAAEEETEDDVLYRSSEDIEAEYPNWLDGTTTDSGKNSTQVEGTRKTYKKVADWIEENMGKNVAILDASSGMGYTADLRERGFDIEDVEPYQSEDRKQNNPATYSSYADIEKQYDYIISNAVLNVIPDNWRADLLHEMVDKLKVGGKLFINTRKAGEERSIKDKIELDSPQEVLVKRNGRIASYQRFFTPQELKEWIESEIGDGYTVEIANKANSGTSGLAAVVVTKNEDVLYRLTGEKGAATLDEMEGVTTRMDDLVLAKAMEARGYEPWVIEVATKWRRIKNGQWRYDLGKKKRRNNDRELYNSDLTTEEKRAIQKYIESLPENYASEHPLAFENNGYIYIFNTSRLQYEDNRTDKHDGFNIISKYDLNNIPNEKQNLLRKILGGDIRTNDRVVGEFETWRNDNQSDSMYSAGATAAMEANGVDDRVDKNSQADRGRDTGTGFENEQAEVNREGAGPLTDREVVMESDLYSKVLGKPRYYGKRQREFVARQRRRMAEKARQVAEKLNLDNVEVLESTEGLTGKKATSKGWFDPRTGKITVVVPNHGSTGDIVETVLHEAVAHHGLRKLFGKNFKNFLDNVYRNVTPEIRAEITELAKKHGWDFHTATEEYLASLAENTNFEKVNPSVWRNIKSFFMKMLAKVGITLDEPLGDNELRYILWRSHQNLVNPGWFNVFGQAEDIAKQYELSVGNYASGEVKTENGEVAAEDDSALLHREGGVPGSAREEYNRKVRRPNESGSVKARENFARRAQEAYHDSMLALKILQDAVARETGNEVKDNENAYIAENRMSSSNKAMVEIYERDFFMPLMDKINALIKEGVEYDDIIRYLHAKHGLERNEYMRRKQAEEAARRDLGEEPAMPNEGDADYEAKVNAKAAWRANLTELTESYVKKFAKRDYSGLTALTETANAKDAEVAAQQMVDEFEKDHDTTPLWKAVNKATKETLRREFVGGLIDRATYDTVSTMFDFYIPLRGWDKDVAANEYEYFTNNNTPVFTPAIKTMRGRPSLSDDPIATIGYMAGSAIARANRNLMKQKFLNFVMNNPTSLATVSEQWYTMDYGTNEWRPDNPAIPEDATPEQVVAIVEAHEANMRAMEKAGFATRERGGLKIGLHATKQEQQQHVVRVMRNGKEYAVYINGNPRAAQAVNGLTNPDVLHIPGEKALTAVKNFMARAFTSRNPAFIFTNLSRDVIWAGTAVAAKEDAEYTKQYTKNVTGVLVKFKLPRLVRKFQNGTLDMNNEVERYFDEFLRNGGETGFTQVLAVEDYKKNIKRFTKEAKNGIRISKKAWRGFWNGIEFLNRSAEDITRFTVYMTSRQMGRSIARSVYDAKEVTVNFNKKGSGEMGARYLNFAYIFFNATIQSLANFGRLMARHPGKMAAALGTFGMMGFLVPVINAALMALGDDDDEENYWNLPEWVRRNNIVLFVPWTEKGFITIPLPHELRPFYGMGENAMSALLGKQTTEDAIKKSLVGFTGMLPIDFTANGGDVVVNVMPTILQPFAQVRANVTHFGTPIYKDNDFNKKYPNWTKAYKGTNSSLVAATKWLNELGGGNNVESGGLLDWNPAVIEHLFESYLGGMGKTFNKMATTVSMIWDEDARIARNIPVASSFYQESDERTAGSQLNREYFDALEEMDDVAHRLSGYRKEITRGNAEYEKMINDLVNSDEFMRYGIIKDYSNTISELNQVLKNNNPAEEEAQEIEGVIQELKKEMLDELEKLQAEE